MQQPRQPQPTALVRRGMQAQRAFWSGRVPANMGKDEMIQLVMQKDLTAAEQAEIDQYNADVHAWNTWVRATRNAKAKAAQVRRNASEVAKVRAQACPVCFASHPGEC